jgi:hypothetical protein
VVKFAIVFNGKFKSFGGRVVRLIIVAKFANFFQDFFLYVLISYLFKKFIQPFRTKVAKSAIKPSKLLFYKKGSGFRTTNIEKRMAPFPDNRNGCPVYLYNGIIDIVKIGV